MKMGTTRSPWLYDAAARHALQSAKRRHLATLHYASRAAALRRLADAEKPLYQSLDEAQKRRFAIAMRFAARRQMAEHHWHG